jgi:hypothetical protein
MIAEYVKKLAWKLGGSKNLLAAGSWLSLFNA